MSKKLNNVSKAIKKYFFEKEKGKPLELRLKEHDTLQTCLFCFYVFCGVFVIILGWIIVTALECRCH
jgi:hypothetical protein